MWEHVQVYDVWRGMMRRCYDSHRRDYQNYGARGIGVCERWHDFHSFRMEIGIIPDGMTLGRIDNDKGYEPSNVRFETHASQANNRRSNRRITAFGKTQNLKQWAAECGIQYSTISKRLNLGWSPESALTLGVDRKIYVTVDGESKSLYDWSDIYGITRDRIDQRIRAGWSPERAVKTPLRKRKA